MTPLKLSNPFFDLAVAPELGCHWTSLKIPVGGAWHDLLQPVPDLSRLPEAINSAGSFLMAPWCNRVRAARFTYRDVEHSLRPNFFDGTAIHGDVRARSWTVRHHRSDYLAASFESANVSDFNFPFPLFFELILMLRENILHADLAITNRHTEAVPVGFGFHPFFVRRLTPLDVDVELVLPAQKVYPIERGLSLGPAVDVDGRTDRRARRPLGAPDFDDCFTDLGPHPIELLYWGSDRKISIDFDPIFNHVFVFAPNDHGLPKPFVAVEPMTMVSAGLNLFTEGWANTGVKILQPGETWGGGIHLKAEALSELVIR